MSTVNASRWRLTLPVLFKHNSCDVSICLSSGINVKTVLSNASVACSVFGSHSICVTSNVAFLIISLIEWISLINNIWWHTAACIFCQYNCTNKKTNTLCPVCGSEAFPCRTSRAYVTHTRWVLWQICSFRSLSIFLAVYLHCTHWNYFYLSVRIVNYDTHTHLLPLINSHTCHH